MLKYFKKAQNMLDESILNGPTAEYHCDKGPLSVQNQTVNSVFLEKNDIMLRAYEEIGFQTISDPLTSDIIGNSPFYLKIRQSPSRRASTAEEYLVPLSDRSNFYLLKNTLATKVIFNDDKEAVGVSIRTSDGEDLNVYADVEVILSAGTINSAQLLMLSGVGPQEDLENLGIEVVADLPVGQQLLDHITAPIGISGKQSAVSALDTFLSVSDMTSFPAPIIGGSFAVGQEQANAQHVSLFFGAVSPIFFYFLFVNFNWNIQVALAYLLTDPMREKLFIITFLTKPKSIGSVTLNSADPTDAPIIKTGFFSDAADIETLSAAVQQLAQVKDASYFSGNGGSFIRPPLTDCDTLEYESEEYWQCYVRVLGSSGFHPSGTCAIGKVVDSDLKVKGVSRLRVVDDSVMPSVPTAKTGPVPIMMAERASDLIKGDYGKTEGYEDFPCN